MDKNAIKKYAVWARRELIDRVSKRAAVYGITEKDMGDPSADSVNGHLLIAAEKRQRQALIRRIQEKGYQQVMEEVAYTWFNRFAALRFMEVNGYLPTHIRVFTDDEGRFRPQILAEAIHLELDGLNMERVYQLKDANQEAELFKYLLIVQCNALNSILPGMFQKIEDYTELLLPDNLLREGSVIEQMITLIPEDDWKDQVQIIGWLYQYYISEKHDSVIDSLHKKAVSKENIPAATQLFTTDWVVRYIVDNSLGRYWIEHNSKSSLRDDLKLLVLPKHKQVVYQNNPVSPEGITVFDPCIGSGHFAAYAFDVLMRIYLEYGYSEREAASLIVKNNIFGADIDERAIQLAYFTVMMKARQYDRRFFSRGVFPNIYAIHESDRINADALEYYCNSDRQIIRNIGIIIDVMKNAKEYGSIITINSPIDWECLFSRFEEVKRDVSLYREMVLDELMPLVASAYLLSKEYTIVVTNPPYFNKYDEAFREFLNARYKNYSGDLFSVFMARNLEFCSDDGYAGFMTPNVWMFLVLYSNLRDMIISNHLITSFLHIAKGSFFKEATVDVCAFVIKKHAGSESISSFVDLSGYKNTMEEQESGLLDVLSCNHDCQYDVNQEMFRSFPDSSLAYWASRRIQDVYEHENLYERTISDGQNITGENDRFLRYSWEPMRNQVGKGKKWCLCAKGGQYRKWYGNIIDIIDWSEEARKHYREDKIARIVPDYLWYKPCITWSNITSYKPSFRVVEEGWLFEKKGASIFVRDPNEYYIILALLNTKVSEYLISTLTQALSFQVRDIRSIPYIEPSSMYIESIQGVTHKCIQLSRNDWDAFEISWDFQRHPLVTPAIDQHYLRLADCWRDWEQACNERFAQLKANEEELNRIFIDIYGLQDELTPEVDDKDVTVRKSDLSRDIRSLISYAVGCMLGRYSLDKPGLAFAGGNWQEWLAQQDAMTYAPDKDGILPITDDEYFYDDIVTMFVDWVKTVYGAATLEENLIFIANALGGKGSPREIIREYFLNDFYKDHLKIYQKRPIYWLFDSGKKNGFKALVYMHRWQPDTIARVRTDYVHEMQSRYRTAIADVEQRINGSSTSERVKLTKRLTALQAQAEELRKYEEKVHHLADQMIGIDLDDGVKVNYAKFADVLAPIK